MHTLKNNPALALLFVAPIFGELFSGSAPLNEFINPFTFITLTLLYGCGAIIARELVVRWGKGWLSLLLLGIAYGIYEEGPVVRSFFDPQWMDLGSLAVYGRVAGVNWVWAFHLTVFHAVVSIMSSVAFVEMLYPTRRADSWVKSKKWWWANWIGLLSLLPIGKLLAPYDAPDVWIALSWLLILVSVGLARLAPQIDLSRHAAPPRPLSFFLLAFMATLIHHALIYVGAENGTYPFPVALLLTALFDLSMLWLILRWRGRADTWDDRHRLALVGGVLGFFLAFPLLIGAPSPIFYLSNPVFLLLLGLAYRRISRTVAARSFV